jgi:hypothetical protein
MASTTVGVRLKKDVWARYSAEAQTRGVSLGTFLRRRLEDDAQLGAEIAALRRAVERATNPSAPAPSATPPITPGALVEILLLLRQLVGPQKVAVAQKEVERRGLETWS